MDGVGKIEKFTARKNQNQRFLHSSSHVLADELSTLLRDKKHFGFYLKASLANDHAVLRKIAGEVMESKTVKSPGKLFAFLLNKHHSEQNNSL